MLLFIFPMKIREEKKNIIPIVLFTIAHTFSKFCLYSTIKPTFSSASILQSDINYGYSEFVERWLPCQQTARRLPTFAHNHPKISFWLSNLNSNGSRIYHLQTFGHKIPPLEPHTGELVLNEWQLVDLEGPHLT